MVLGIFSIDGRHDDDDDGVDDIHVYVRAECEGEYIFIN